MGQEIGIEAVAQVGDSVTRFAQRIADLGQAGRDQILEGNARRLYKRL